ncbi:hypothetical protein KR032_006398, partial [Drosophila birchii]
LFILKTHSELVYKVVNVDCQGNPTRVANISCHVKAINWNLAVVNMDCFLIVPLRKAIIRLQVFKKDYSNQFKPFLIDVSINMCEIIEKRSYIPYGVMIWKLLKQFTNANHSCPFSVRPYIISHFRNAGLYPPQGQMTARNGYLDTSLIPPFPQGVYMFSFVFTDMNSTHSEYMGTVKISVQAMEHVKTKKR